MKRVNMAAHLRAPVGLWRVICARCNPSGGRNLRDGARVVFTHLWERRQ